VSQPVSLQLRFQAQLRPDALAVRGPGGLVSRRTLMSDVDRLATELLERGLTPDDMVGLHLGLSYLHLLLILALDRIDVPSTSLALRPGMPVPRDVRQQLGLTAIVAATAAPPDPPCRWIWMAEQHRPKLGAADPARLDGLDSWPDALVRVGWSSGTTGGVKGAPLTRLLQHDRMVARRLARGLGPETRWIASMPFAATPGYIMPLAVLAAGGTVLLPHPGMDFTTVASAFGGTASSITPPMLAELLARDAERPQRLDTIDMLMISGAHLPPDVARAAIARLTPHIWVGYGASETDGIAHVRADMVLGDPTAVGYLHPWIEAQIVDAEDRPLPTGREGLLRLRSTQTIAGYHDNETATEQNFRGGWFYPGDVGAMTEDRLLRISGRAEDLIVHRDVARSPEAIEDVLRTLPGVRDVAVFGLPGADGTPDIAAAFVLDDGVDAARLLELARDQLGEAVPTRLFKLATLPRNANGKLQRRELATLAQRSRP
jgi:acyl-CoA synthetase (AMP-forming)/AMP-acid ligase II